MVRSPSESSQRESTAQVTGQDARVAKDTSCASRKDRKAPQAQRNKRHTDTKDDIPTFERSLNRPDKHDGRATRLVEQEILQREWNHLSFEQKAIRRAQRALCGERCSECGCVGYFRRNCPKCPPVRYDVRIGGWRSPTPEELRYGSGKHHATTGHSNDTAAGPSRGFLWGVLAEEATRPLPDKSCAGKAQISGAISTAASATMVQMPSLAGSSELSSGAVSDLRRALVWEDEGTTVPCAGSVVSSLDGITSCGADYLRQEAKNAATDQGTRTDERPVTPTGDTNTSLEHAASNKAGIVSTQRERNHTRLQELEQEDVAWRWPELCSSPAAEEWRILDTRETGVLAHAPSHDPFETGRSGANGGEELLSLPTPPRGSYLRLRDNTVLTVQENFNLALQRLVEAARTQALSVASESFVDGLLQGPRGGPPRERYYTPTTYKDFRDFFDAEEEEASRQQQPKAHAYLGGLRETGSLRYLFDRTTPGQKDSLASHLRGDYEPQPQGYRGKTVHALVAWRRPNTALDRHASSRRQAIKRVAASDRALREQSVWVVDQKRARENRRKRANHLLEVFRNELHEEQMREVELLKLPTREQRLFASGAMRASAMAADRIMRTIKDYGLMGNIEDAHYVMYTLHAARRAGLVDSQRLPPSQPQRRTTAPSSGTNNATVPTPALHSEAPAVLVSDPVKEISVVSTAESAFTGPATAAGTRQEHNPGVVKNLFAGSSRVGAVGEVNPGCGKIAKGASDTPVYAKGRQAIVKGNDVDEMSPYSLRMPRPAKPASRLIPPRIRGRRRGSSASMRSNDSDSVGSGESNAVAEEARRRHAKAEVIRTFNLVGHSIRRGVDEDTTGVPALIPIPKGFSSSGIGPSTAGEKSFAAGRIMEALRAGEVDAITGRALKSAVPLWHRATEEIDSSGAGSVLYSDLIGHTYSVLVGPRKTIATKPR